MYLEKGAYLTESQMKHIDRGVQEPNRTYAHKYKDYLELNNRRPRTTAKRINELRFILKRLPQDAKLATIPGHGVHGNGHKHCQKVRHQWK